MRVVATKRGFFAGSRKRIGDVFDWPEGQKMGAWVKPVASDASAKAETEAARRAENARQIAGAVAASGGKAAKDKVQTAQDLV